MQGVQRNDCERIAEHLDEHSGWLSIDVINVLCAANFAMDVEAAPFPVQSLAQESEVAFLVNWNQRHWTVLRQQAADGPWTHINSIGGDGRLWYGRKDVASKERLQVLFKGLQDVYGGFSLHRIRRGEHCGGGAIPGEGEHAGDCTARSSCSTGGARRWGGLNSASS